MKGQRKIGVGISLGIPTEELFITNQREDVDRMLARGWKIVFSPDNPLATDSIFSNLWVLAFF
ncbi:hypothetical protein [Planococcus faecalis]|uniref:hypothetical protein n=1 Tax=Planococcus faecalis TaxID=1598147 RepID=UPI00115F936A|nr:hypothetical protein [Planococcus faecalis]